MKIFNHIDSYLQNESCDSPEPILNGNNRPIIVLDDRETLAEIPRFLLPLQNKIYEVGFPLVTSTDWHREKSLMVKKSLKLSRDNQEISLSIYLQDQVLDSTQLNDEQTHQNLKQELSNRCEHHTADTIAVIVGLFNELYAQSGWDKKFPLLKLPSCLKKLSLEEARQPLVVSLDKRYKLRHNLEILTPKLRSQLNRTVEMTPLSRIQ